MAKSRTTAPTVSDVSEADAQAALQRYAQNNAKLKGIEAAIEQAVNKIREKHAEEIKRLQSEAENDFRIVQFFAEKNRKDLFGERKSADWGSATIGLRIGTPAVKISVKRDTWDDVLLRLPDDYKRVKVEPMKDKIIADREFLASEGLLSEWGLTIEQKETFYVEVKEESLTV